MREQNPETARHAEQFRDIRGKTGLEPQEFGEMLGLRAQTVIGMESGTRTLPRDATFYRQLALMPNISPEDILPLVTKADGTRMFLVEIGEAGSMNPEFDRIIKEFLL